MKQVGKFKLFNNAEFEIWTEQQRFSRKVDNLQLHHTWIPAYRHFDTNNHFKLCQSMETSHLNRGFNQIGQNITIFPDGLIMVCRPIDTKPAGIKYNNTGAICIENVGDFDTDKDNMTDLQKESILNVLKVFLIKFNLQANDSSIVYHHWFHLGSGKRNNGGPKNTNKTCPGTNFFGGNKVNDFKKNLLPLITKKNDYV
ncbi:peptidoglycan recognition protein family protein [Luteirhabdus pelagi]|uniref:peptidoglycan recognition protein family protein n=1 Tax=Luteirhabdus pelagi TaxID=2792783 RepID=UPI00193A11A9|nr:N-acetylmuramoyl-L-alanine amidase [Luteirhabdus pelagi]